ncbi:hypothetical protein L5B71_05705 [Avibacterium sp. 21-586]|uniref:hypothetical protein n=1 Tax=Avibacterium sp. 21-586 TaxID=2911534 RepID=UPI002247D189|nr:hypothetical protein [Avibacterium sp. 21-586]MCW9710352.1 hypothetical protein [Avibacterium sp. 21-586]
MKLQQQLTFLLQRKLIDEEIIEWVFHLREYLLEQWHADVESRQAFMLLNHFAMALGRIKRGYAVHPLDQDIFSEMQSDTLFPRVFQRYLELLALIPIEIPESEQTHFIANIYALSLSQPQILNECI